MEGSEGRIAVNIKDANKRETTYDDSKRSVPAASGKSIIEEWKNPSKYPEDLLRSDHTYEERAVDVIIDHRPRDFPKRLVESSLSSKITNNNAYNVNSNDDKLIKIKRPQGGGTVRSIPIKDYQASIAYNIGTLRRSVAPQSQFESLVSEPERSVYVSSKKRIPISGSLHHRAASQPTCVVSQAEVTNVSKKSFCHFCSSQHDQRECYCPNTDLRNTADRNAEDNRYFDKTEEQKSQNGSDIEEYFRRSSRRKLTSTNHRSSRQTRESSQGNARTITATERRDEKAKATEKGLLQLGEGHVGQKVSTYEQNARHSLRDFDPKYRSVFELKRHRAIGVPLVGMHNACGLPVVASWHDHDLLEPLRVSRRVMGTVGPIYKSPRTIPNVRRRTQPKRKAPQPDRTMIYPRHTDGSIKRKQRRSSLTTTKVGSLSSKNSFKRTTRSRRYGIKASSLVDTFGRKSIKEGNSKRTTLYAKDDGEEAVQVLKSLCLNPLARANSETDMIW